jgi:nucleotide-binding universal stress UspA family protein
MIIGNPKFYWKPLHIIIMEEILYHSPDRLFWRTKKILLPVDGSKSTARAATVAYELAEITNGKIFIIHVINIGMVQQIATMSDSDSLEVLTRYMANGERLLEGYKKAASEFNLEIELILEQGLPSSKIIEVARKRRVDVIVMGSTGASSTSRTGLGSATERVIRKAPCAVLVIK